MGPDSMRVVRFYAVLMMYVTFIKVEVRGCSCCGARLCEEERIVDSRK